MRWEALGGLDNLVFNNINVNSFNTFYIMFRIDNMLIFFFQKLIKRYRQKFQNRWSGTATPVPSVSTRAVRFLLQVNLFHQLKVLMNYLRWTIWHMGRSRWGHERVPIGTGRVERPCHTGEGRAPKNKCNMWRFSTAMDNELVIICHYYCSNTFTTFKPK